MFRLLKNRLNGITGEYTVAKINDVVVPESMNGELLNITMNLEDKFIMSVAETQADIRAGFQL